LQFTSKKALLIGALGVRTSREFAAAANTRVKARLQAAALERAAAAARAAALRRETDIPVLGGAAREFAQGDPEAIPPSKASQAILNLAQGANRKLAAPVAALVAAGVVYLVGSQLLGSRDSVALSHTTDSPEIPDLGSLTTEEPEENSEQLPEEAADSGEAAPPNLRGKKPAKTPPGPSPMQSEVVEMPDGLSWPGKGLIEVVTSQDELIYVDGVFTGRGPLRRIPVSPGEHEVSIRTDGAQRTGTIQVRSQKCSRALFSGT
jgi:HAMP domain-containing protein